jgi:4-hydroxybenzoate polyprenyltransferase
MSSVASAQAPLAGRMWTYQRERFPLAAYVPLIGISAAAAAAYSSAARGRPGLPPWPVLMAGVVTGIAFFFLLRVADEHKDAHVDRQFRPELPVPRGLVSLAELRGAALVVALIVVLANALVAPRLLLALVPAALWAGLMAREFFVAEWLRARPAAYLLSHMGIMPLLFTYLTGLDWLAAGARPPPTLPLFLGLAFLNGILVEIGRKIRAPRDEREGVETYTATWGVRAAPTVWLAALALAAVLGALAAPQAVADEAAVPLAVAGIAAALPAVAFLRAPSSAGAKRIETAAGLWTLVSYLILALTPFFFAG